MIVIIIIEFGGVLPRGGKIVTGARTTCGACRRRAVNAGWMVYEMIWVWTFDLMEHWDISDRHAVPVSNLSIGELTAKS
jgi:hypothetical protein